MNYRGQKIKALRHGQCTPIISHDSEDAINCALWGYPFEIWRYSLCLSEMAEQLLHYENFLDLSPELQQEMMTRNFLENVNQRNYDENNT